MAPTDAQRLWDLTQARAAELDKDMQDLADEAGVTTNTLWRWRKGASASDKTNRRLHIAFGWAQGSRDAILAGGGPTSLGDGPYSPTAADEPEPEGVGDWRVPAVRALLAGLPQSRKEKVAREALEEPEKRRRTS